MTEDLVSKNLSAIRAEINAACERCGRHSTTVRLVAVTKYAEWEWVQQLVKHHQVFGENRPQQLSERRALMPTAEWHLIGQLQRNKARVAVESAAMIHSVDSLRLLSKIASISSELNCRPRLLLQANVTGENSKSGFSPDELLQAWPECAALQQHVEIAGLMTMAPATSDPENARPAFQALRELRDTLAQHSATTDNNIVLSELSMGMSGDFTVAIEEGATLVRIGSRLFEGL